LTPFPAATYSAAAHRSEALVARFSLDDEDHDSFPRRHHFGARAANGDADDSYQSAILSHTAAQEMSATPRSYYLDPANFGSGGSGHLLAVPDNPTMADEVAFISGVYPDGTLPLYAFAAWNGDKPATYTGGFTLSSKWGSSTAQTAGGTISYYFNPSSNWSSAEKTAMASGLALWSAVANISFVATTNSSAAQIVFTRGSDGSAYTNTSTSDPGGGGVTGGSVLLQITKATISIDTSVAGFGPIDGVFTSQGGYPTMTFLHEEGHALGLGHAGPYNGNVTASTQQFSAWDTRLWSIMSYIEPRTTSAKFYSSYTVTGTNWNLNGGSDPTGLMILDIQAIQQLYGMPVSTPLSGGQVFGFHANITGAIAPYFDFTQNTLPILTLWDMGTGNTLDLSGYSSASIVNLNAGTFSSFAGLTNNLSIAYGTAIDSFVGTAGNDTVTGNNDGDTFTGGAGNDSFTGGTGVDTVVFSGNFADYSVTNNHTGGFLITDNRAGSPDGSDSVNLVEFARFADQTVSLTSGTPPTLSGGSSTIGYTEQAAAVALMPNITVGYLTTPTMSEAVVFIVSGYVTGDTLNFTDQNGISGNFDANGHILYLTGEASAADYQTALRSVTFSSPSDNPTANGNVSRSVSTYIYDSDHNNSNSITTTINVTAINDAPTLAGAGGSVAYTEQLSAAAPGTALVLGDVDNASLAGATVTISSGFVSGDTLAFTAQNGITGSWNAGTHVLTLSGSASVANYQAALRSVTFFSASDNPDNYGANTSRTLTWQVDDGQSANHASNTGTTTVAITAVNDAPSLGGAGNSVAYTEQAAAVTLDSALTTADPDNTALAGATVTISSGFVTGDSLNFTNQNGITGSWNAATHVLTLTGTASLANYQAALRSVTFSSTGDDPTAGGNITRTVTWVADDGQPANHASSGVTTTINVTAVNDAPILGGAGNTVSYTEQAAAIALDTALTAADPDNATLAGATVTISNGFVAGDVLSFTSQNGITGSWNAATHVLTLSGSASLANYQAALRSVTFSSTSDDPTAGGNTTRTVTWVVDDGQSANNTSTGVTSTVNITAVNDAPTLGGAGNTVGYTEQAAGTVLASALTVADPDNTSLASASVTISAGFVAGDTLNFTNQNGITGSWNAGTHVLTLSGSASIANYQAALRSVTFSSANDDPTASGSNPTRTITWLVDDGQSANHASNSTTTTVAVTAVNDAPVLSGAGNSVGYTEQASPIVLDGALALSDPDNTTLAGAAVTISAGFTAGDALNFTSQNGITGSWNASTHVLTLSGSASLANYQAALRSVTYSSASDTPDAGGTTRKITWQVDDGQSANHASNTGTTTVTITAVNDAPVLSGGGNTVAYTEQATAVALTTTLAVADVDNTALAGATITISSGFVAGDTLNFTNQNGITGSWNAGTHVLTLSGSASVANYQAALRSIAFSSTSDNPTNFGANASRTITWTVDDGQSANHASNSTTTTVNVTAVNDAPTISGTGNSVGYTEQASAVALATALTLADLDNTALAGATVTISNGFVAGDALNFVNQNGITGAWNAATHILTLSGSASIANYQAALRSITFSSPSDNPGNFGANTTRTVTWQVDDGQSANHASNTGTTTVNITAVDDPPTLHNDAFATTESTIIGLGLNLFADNGQGADTDPDSVLAVTAVNGVTASVGQTVTLASGALLTVNADGTFSYDPNHAFDWLPAPGSGSTVTTAADSFTYSVGGVTATAAVTLTGEDSNDTFAEVMGANNFNGGIGTDTLILGGNRADYTITFNTNTLQYTLTDNRPSFAGTAIITKDIENFHFADGTFSYAAYTATASNGLGGTNTTVYDAADAQPWASRTVSTDASGNIASLETVTHGGTEWTDAFDVNNAFDFAWSSSARDSQGRVITQVTAFDDGTHSLYIADLDNSYAFTWARVFYDATWNVTSVEGQWDSGGGMPALKDLQTALDTWLWYTTPYDPDQGAPVATLLNGGPGAEWLYGYAGNDTLNGGGGNDHIIGGTGNDTLTGGTGDDIFMFTYGDGLDTITDFTPGNASNDTISLHDYGIANFAALQPFMSQAGSDVLIAFDDQNHITLQNVTLAQLNSGDFVFS
jgi:hypothetical protein